MIDRGRKFFIVYIFFVLIVQLGCSPKEMTEEEEIEKWSKVFKKWEAVKDGMSVDEVKTLLGNPHSIVGKNGKYMLSYRPTGWMVNRKIVNSNLYLDAFMIFVTNDVVESTHIGYR